ncbi:MAG: type IV pilus assembly protein PilM [Candidatus Liptonbacteria bacterium]|nr:type IV pilus assembly protein PilM [Candidatus Liptonbacteria bacterium]
MAGLLNFFNSISGGSYLGVDIGTTSIKLAEVEQGESGPRLLNYGFLETQSALLRANTALQTSTLKLFDKETVEFLKALIAQVKPRSRNVVASLPPFSAFTTIISLPEMEQKELEQAIVYQARQYIPLPISEVALDWSKVGETEDEKGKKHLQILLISVPQEQIKKYQRIFIEAGLTLKALELESLALMRSVIGNDPTPTLLLDIGSLSTGIMVVDGGQLKFSGQTDFSSSSLTQAVATSLNLNPLRAEELKIEKGIAGTGANYELSTIMLPILDAIISEVRKVEFVYKTQFPVAKPIERMILSGGGASLLGIEKYFEKQLGIPVVKATPLSRFEYPQILEPLTGELNSALAVSLGLGLKNL